MTARIRVDLTVAGAAGRDAGNRSMRAAGRTVWNDDDWNLAAAVTARLMSLQSEPGALTAKSKRRP